MSLHRFFLQNQRLAEYTDDSFVLELEAEDLKHAKVLRLKQREHIAVIDADLDYFECEVVSFREDGSPVVRIAERLDTPRSSFEITLVQGLAKADKFDTVLRHSTELGVDIFIPYISERSVVRLDEKKTAAKIKRWKSIVKSASVQSGRISIPDVFAPVDTAGLYDILKSYTAVLICWEQADISLSVRQALKNMELTDKMRIAIVIGPEGGLCDHEVNQLMSCNRKSMLVSLGNTILRTETAGIVAPALVINELREHLEKIDAVDSGESVGRAYF